MKAYLVGGAVRDSFLKIPFYEKDWENWAKKMSVTPVKEEIRKVTLPRPGHADLAGIQKYGFDDIRNVLERSSARETTMRVALGSLCRKLLEDIDISPEKFWLGFEKIVNELEPRNRELINFRKKIC